MEQVWQFVCLGTLDGFQLVETLANLVFGALGP